jgi:hypothetical protein
MCRGCKTQEKELHIIEFVRGLDASWLESLLLPLSMADREATGHRGWGAPAATTRLDHARDRGGVEELEGVLIADGDKEGVMTKTTK